MIPSLCFQSVKYIYIYIYKIKELRIYFSRKWFFVHPILYYFHFLTPIEQISIPAICIASLFFSFYTTNNRKLIVIEKKGFPFRELEFPYLWFLRWHSILPLGYSFVTFQFYGGRERERYFSREMLFKV